MAQGLTQKLIKFEYEKKKAAHGDMCMEKKNLFGKKLLISNPVSNIVACLWFDLYPLICIIIEKCHVLLLITHCTSGQKWSFCIIKRDKQSKRATLNNPISWSCLANVLFLTVHRWRTAPPSSVKLKEKQKSIRIKWKGLGRQTIRTWKWENMFQSSLGTALKKRFNAFLLDHRFKVIQ